MTNLLWKAVRPDGTTQNGVVWKVGKTTTHPTSTVMVRNAPSTFLSLSTEPGETLIGGSWPCRLLRVEPVGDVIGSDRYPHKRCVLAARVVEEVEAWRALGPQGEHVGALIQRIHALTPVQVDQLSAAWIVAWDAAMDAANDAARDTPRDAARDTPRVAARVAARNAAWDAAMDAANDAARDAAWDTPRDDDAWHDARDDARDAARYATGALVVRDRIGRHPRWDQAAYDRLVGPVASVLGPLHPDDA